MLSKPPPVQRPKKQQHALAAPALVISAATPCASWISGPGCAFMMNPIEIYIGKFYCSHVQGMARLYPFVRSLCFCLLHSLVLCTTLLQNRLLA